MSIFIKKDKKYTNNSNIKKKEKNKYYFLWLMTKSYEFVLILNL